MRFAFENRSRVHEVSVRGSPLRLLIPCVVAALSQGCDRPVLRDVVEGNVRDSAGVRLVEFVRLPKGEGALRFASRARLRLGGLRDNDSLEFDPRGIYLTATRLADGRLVVGDNRRLKFFKSDGSPQQIVGRGGAGPGEFSAIRDLCPQSDSTLVVLDDGRWLDGVEPGWNAAAHTVASGAGTGQRMLLEWDDS